MADRRLTALTLLHFLLQMLLLHELELLLHHLRAHGSQPIHRVVRDHLAASLGVHLLAGLYGGAERASLGGTKAPQQSTTRPRAYVSWGRVAAKTIAEVVDAVSVGEPIVVGP